MPFLCIFVNFCNRHIKLPGSHGCCCSCNRTSPRICLKSSGILISLQPVDVNEPVNHCHHQNGHNEGDLPKIYRFFRLRLRHGYVISPSSQGPGDRSGEHAQSRHHIRDLCSCRRLLHKYPRHDSYSIQRSATVGLRQRDYGILYYNNWMQLHRISRTFSCAYISNSFKKLDGGVTRPCSFFTYVCTFAIV